MQTLLQHTNGEINAAAEGSGSDISTTVTQLLVGTHSAVLTKTFTFASRNQLRYFFNAGGHDSFVSWSRSGGTGSDHRTHHGVKHLTAAGTMVLTGAAASKTIAGVAYTGITKIGGSGTNQDTLNINRRCICI